MDFYAVLDQVAALLRQRGRASYRALKIQFQLDDEQLEALKEELIDIQELAIDQDGKMLVWKGAVVTQETGIQSIGESEPRLAPADDSGTDRPRDLRLDTAERRQLTVMFCDLVGSTALSEQLDPEELREVVQRYQATCTEVIRRYDGHIAQHLGDGLLVYFGYPKAHEDDARRAVRTALGIVGAMQQLSFPTIALPRPLQVRIGTHTGVVVIGEVGSSEKREMLALGETPNLAARLQGSAEPDTVVISAATQHLVQGLFEYQDLGAQMLKGLSTPVSVYRVMQESVAQSRFEAAVSAGLTPLVGRQEELSVLQQRWTQAQEGTGQVVLLSGEPGIGKSRLVQVLKEQVTIKGATHIEFHCSPYHQNSALYPIIEHLQRLLQFAREDALTTKLEKLQHTLARYRFTQTETFPLLAALLSLPHPEGYALLTGSPQQQKEKMQAALVAWLVEEAEQRPVYTVWEDLHWADPSTLEVLTLLLDQAPTTRLLALLTCRPEFIAPWGSRSYLTQLTVNRLGHSQVELMVERVTGASVLPPEVVQQIVSKTDGVPLFVEELTKAVLESVGVQHAVPLHLTIPSTLQDSLMARLDRLGPAKDIAQLGATIGREFSYELLHAVSNRDEGGLRNGLKQLVEAELLYQRGLALQAHYLFKHALIQDTAYQSLLKSTRQQYHQQIARMLEGQFPETKETQPELLAHHYTEANLIEQAIPYWQRAGERAIQRSAHAEAISHLTTALELLKTLPDTPERTRQELTLQIALGAPLRIAKGYAAPEVEHVYARAQALCQQVGETPQLFPVLWGLWYFYAVRAEYQRARELGTQCLTLAQREHDPALLVQAHFALGLTLRCLGELTPAREQLERGIALYDPLEHRSLAFLYGQDPKVTSLSIAAWALWGLGYPDQALKRIHNALTLAQELSHPYSLVYALIIAAFVHQPRREGQLTQERAETVITLCTEQGFPVWLPYGTILRGWALSEQGQREEGIAQMRYGLAASRAAGIEMVRSYWLALLAEAYGKAGQAEEGLVTLAEALTVIDKSGERFYEAELYRIKGELLLAQEGLRLQAEGLREKTEEAEGCFLKAIEVSQKQQAKSLELRAVVSLARLWQQQGKKAEARQRLAEIYGWFTEGFDTKDLQDAKALLDELAA